MVSYFQLENAEIFRVAGIVQIIRGFAGKSNFVFQLSEDIYLLWKIKIN